MVLELLKRSWWHRPLSVLIHNSPMLPSKPYCCWSYLPMVISLLSFRPSSPIW